MSDRISRLRMQCQTCESIIKPKPLNGGGSHALKRKGFLRDGQKGGEFNINGYYRNLRGVSTSARMTVPSYTLFYGAVARGHGGFNGTYTDNVILNVSKTDKTELLPTSSTLSSSKVIDKRRECCEDIIKKENLCCDNTVKYENLGVNETNTYLTRLRLKTLCMNDEVDKCTKACLICNSEDTTCCNHTMGHKRYRVNLSRPHVKNTRFNVSESGEYSRTRYLLKNNISCSCA